MLTRHPTRPELAFASRDPARAEACRRRYGGRAAWGSYGAALRDPGTDVIVIATPPDRHRPLALDALAAGKHVVVEKPAFLTAEDVAAVRAAALRAGRRVLVAENYCYKPLLQTLRHLLADGVVGRPLFLEIDATRTQRTPGWRDDPALAGPGALFEGGIHWIHFLASLGLSVRRIHGHQPGRNGRPDRSMLVVVEYAGGPVATLHYSWEARAALRGLRRSRLQGTDGTVLFETNGLGVLVLGRRRRVFWPNLGDIAGYRAMWADFLRALTTGTEPQMTLDLAERDLRLVEAAYASRD